MSNLCKYILENANEILFVRRANLHMQISKLLCNVDDHENIEIIITCPSK